MRQPKVRNPVIHWLVALLCLTATSSLAAQLPLPRARAETVGMSSDRLARMRPAMQGFVDRGDVAGVVTLIARAGRLVSRSRMERIRAR